MTLQELNEMKIECWPDNDGGLWYFDPVTGIAETVREFTVGENNDND